MSSQNSHLFIEKNMSDKFRGGPDAQSKTGAEKKEGDTIKFEFGVPPERLVDAVKHFAARHAGGYVFSEDPSPVPLDKNNVENYTKWGIEQPSLEEQELVDAFQREEQRAGDYLGQHYNPRRRHYLYGNFGEMMMGRDVRVFDIPTGYEPQIGDVLVYRRQDSGNHTVAYLSKEDAERLPKDIKILIERELGCPLEQMAVTEKNVDPFPPRGSVENARENMRRSGSFGYDSADSLVADFVDNKLIATGMDSSLRRPHYQNPGDFTDEEAASRFLFNIKQTAAKVNRTIKEDGHLALKAPRDSYLLQDLFRNRIELERSGKLPEAIELVKAILKVHKDVADDNRNIASLVWWYRYRKTLPHLKLKEPDAEILKTLGLLAE